MAALPQALADLPVVDVVDALGAALTDHHAAILVAPPGAGKTTAVPLALLDAPWLGGRRIVILEPRRLATRAAARRMASALGETVGETVGYQTRDERRIGPQTRIEVVTEGVLTRRLQHDPTLAGTGLVIFDEIHERNLTTDLGLALLLDARAALGLDVRILAMSATLDAATLRGALGEVPTLTSDGRQHSVEVRWLPRRATDRIEPAVVAAIRRALAEEHGDVLVFLPGIGEIRRTESLLAEGGLGAVDVFPLAGALSLAEQDAALAPSPPGRRRVVLSTDIAESSLTVPGIRVVVDAGLARVPRLDVRTGMTRLTTVSTSRSSAEQRAGRAGRLEPGVCYRLWSKVEQATRPAHLPAEITQVDLAGLALELAVWGTPAENLTFLDRPPATAYRQAVELLTALDLLDDSGKPSPSGRRVAALPVHPRLGRMIDRAGDDQSLACLLAALIDERDVLRGRSSDLPADLAERVAVVAGWSGHAAADRRAIDQVIARAADIARRSGATLDVDGVHPERSGRVLLGGFPDRLAVRRTRPGNFQLRTGTAATVAPSDSLAGERFIVAADLDGNRTRAVIRRGAAISTADVIDRLGDHIERRVAVEWDNEALVERTEFRLGGMLLDQRTRPAERSAETTAALIARVLDTRFAALGGNRAEQLRARVALLAERDAATPWPDWSEDTLRAAVDVWLVPFLDAARSADDLARLDLGMILSTQLDWETSTRLADVAPRSLTTPAGRDVTIDYTSATPTARVRVQDLFGLTVHPTVAHGLPVVLELLSPADRPVQITSDLPGFWTGSWAEVRKEMAGRYPKHAWPVDPRVAPPKRLKDR